MNHNSSEHMFAMEEIKTPDFKARLIAENIENLLEAGAGSNPTKILKLRDGLVELVDNVIDEPSKARYLKLIVDCNPYLFQSDRSREIKTSV